MNVSRSVWTRRLEDGWASAPIVWLTGVRRLGKTVLARSMPDSDFFNCDLPSTEARFRDPETALSAVRGPLLVLDEVHQLPDPSRLLKIAADSFPGLRLLATGSSTLAATSKFRDSLAGRKRVVELTPVLVEELPAFGIRDLDRRLLHGGLPQPLQAEKATTDFYSEWLDSYFSRDVQELFHLEKRGAFLRTALLVLAQSGGMLDATAMAKHVGVSRPTILHWLDVLQITHFARLLSPFSGGGRREIIAQPKLYGFDTGFVCHASGWDSLRSGDRGVLWEHLVLETLVSIPVARIHYWRDKQQREVDFVLPRSRDLVDAIECKWNPDAFEPRSLAVFREAYPRGRNLVVSPGIPSRYTRNFRDLEVTFLPVTELRGLLAG